MPAVHMEPEARSMGTVESSILPFGTRKSFLCSGFRTVIMNEWPTHQFRAPILLSGSDLWAGA